MAGPIIARNSSEKMDTHLILALLALAAALLALAVAVRATRRLDAVVRQVDESEAHLRAADRVSDPRWQIL